MGREQRWNPLWSQANQAPSCAPVARTAEGGVTLLSSPFPFPSFFLSCLELATDCAMLGEPLMFLLSNSGTKSSNQSDISQAEGTCIEKSLQGPPGRKGRSTLVSSMTSHSNTEHLISEAEGVLSVAFLSFFICGNIFKSQNLFLLNVKGSRYLAHCSQCRLRRSHPVMGVVWVQCWDSVS